MTDFDISYLKNHTPDFYGNWVVWGLATYKEGSEEFKPRSVYAFPGAERIILSKFSGIEDLLVQVYRNLSEPDQESFEKGVASRIQQLNLNNSTDANVAQSLIDVASRLDSKLMIAALKGLTPISPEHPDARRWASTIKRLNSHRTAETPKA